jgi:hypothetical protein
MEEDYLYKFGRSDILCVPEDVRILGAVLCRWASSSSWTVCSTLMMKALRTFETSQNIRSELTRHESSNLEEFIACQQSQSCQACDTLL